MPNSVRIAIATMVLTVTALGAASISTNSSTHRPAALFGPGPHAVVRADGGGGGAPTSPWQPGDMTWG